MRSSGNSNSSNYSPFTSQQGNSGNPFAVNNNKGTLPCTKTTTGASSIPWLQTTVPSSATKTRQTVNSTSATCSRPPRKIAFTAGTPNRRRCPPSSHSTKTVSPKAGTTRSPPQFQERGTPGANSKVRGRKSPKLKQPPGCTRALPKELFSSNARLLRRTTEERSSQPPKSAASLTSKAWSASTSVSTPSLSFRRRFLPRSSPAYEVAHQLKPKRAVSVFGNWQFFSAVWTVDSAA